MIGSSRGVGMTVQPGGRSEGCEQLSRREFMFGSVGVLVLPRDGSGRADDLQLMEQREVEDAFGTVVVPDRPQRIVAVRHHHIGNMLALGVVPVGIVPDASEFPFPGMSEALENVVNVRADADWMLDIEKALALDPDLILEMSGQPGKPWNEEVCSLASAAAATLCFPYGYTSAEDVGQNMRDVGVALGMEDEAEQVIADFDARVAELKASFAAADFTDKPVANIIWQGNGDFFVPIDRSTNLILSSLGIAQPSFQDDPTGGEVGLSLENLDTLNEAYANVVLLEGAGTQEELEANQLWQLLEPVKNGRVIFLDADRSGWDHMPALMSMLDDVERDLLPLAEASAGD